MCGGKWDRFLGFILNGAEKSGRREDSSSLAAASVADEDRGDGLVSMPTGEWAGAVALSRDAHLRRKVRAEDGAPGG